MSIDKKCFNRFEEKHTMSIKEDDFITVLYDHQIMVVQKYGGISRYYYELFKRFKESKYIKPILYCWFSINTYFSLYLSISKFNLAKGRGWINRFLTILYLKTHKIDVLHPTYYNPYYIKRYKGKVVITVYDMIHELFPQWFSKDKVIEQKKLSIHRADKIIAISQSTKRDLLKIYPDIPESKIKVIYIASDFKKNESQKLNYKFPKKYILFVGNRWIYKNYNLFFQSVSQLLKDDKELSLVCVGGGKFSDAEMEMHGNLSNRIFQMSVDDDILSFAYSHALCFVFPSLYEGFGIPTLEAFACDCPVVLSNTSSMPEVGGNAAVYFDPYDADDMRGKIKRVIYDSVLRQQMIVKGRNQLKKFDWNQIAKQTMECYEEVLKG